MASATIFEAKTNLSKLIKKAQAGEKVIITSGRDKTPVVQLEVLKTKKKQRLGFAEIPGFKLGAAFWEPLPKGWDGYDDNPNDPLHPSFALLKKSKKK
jgi:hypothetical protein